MLCLAAVAATVTAHGFKTVHCRKEGNDSFLISLIHTITHIDKLPQIGARKKWIG